MTARAAAPAAVAVREIRPGESLRSFIDLSWRVNAGDPSWVAPLRMDLAVVLDRKKHPYHRHAEVAYFLAERGGEPVGRIAATVNHRYNEFHEARQGFFGFFEAVDDAGVARALVDAAAAWLRERGMERMQGPMSFSTNEEAPLGVLVQGFEVPPYVFMPHNPPYYDRILEEAGLAKAMDLLAYSMTGEPPERLVRGVERLAKRQGVTVRGLDMRRFAEEVATIKEVYNSAWARNWGFVPMTDEEFDHVGKSMKLIVDPALVLVAEKDGRAVGFSIALPDLNQVLKKIPSGRLLPFGAFRFLWGKRKIDALRLITLGFRPEFQHQGLGALLYLRTWEEGVKRGYYRAEASWVLENNLEMRRALENLGAQLYKRMRIYERELV